MSRIPSRRGALLAAAFAINLAGCMTGGAGGAARSGSADLLTAAEMEALADHDLYEVVQRLRPHWLQVRQAYTITGAKPMAIVIDGTRQVGSLELLRGMRTVDVEEVRFMNSRDATTQYGLDMMSGALIITTRRGPIRT